MKQSIKRKSKVTIIFFLLALAFIAFIFRALYISLGTDDTLPSLRSKQINRAVRGDIVSKNKFTLSTSKKLYMAEIDTRNLNPDEKDVFIKLFNIYTGIKKAQIRKTIESHKGYVRFSYAINEKDAKHLKMLATKLLKRGVFIEYIDIERGKRFLHGLNVVDSEEYREFIYKDTLTPVIGYMRKIEKDSMIKVKAVKGLEYFYREKLSPIQDSIISGQRDVGSNIIYNKDAIIKHRLDGYRLNLSVDLRLQQAIETLLDRYKKIFGAKEIIASVMDSRSGAILSLATSNRFNPNAIKNIAFLNVSAVEYTFEPGSVMKPITYAIALREKKVKPNTIFNTQNGKLKIGKRVITDAHKFKKWMSAKNAIVHSSNVVLAQMVQKLDSFEFYQGLRDFGFSSSSGIDLPYEHIGEMPSLSRFGTKIYKATLSYGYSIKVNFIQLLRAYSVFNNGGYLVTPYLTKYLTSPTNKIVYPRRKKDIKIISTKIANSVKEALIKTVEKGTGIDTKTFDIEVGGKTGTAHIANKKVYKDRYNSSFIGFANDKKRKYTIGVTVIEPKGKYFASQTAVPVFKSVIDLMIYNGYLKQ